MTAYVWTSIHDRHSRLAIMPAVCSGEEIAIKVSKQVFTDNCECIEQRLDSCLKGFGQTLCMSRKYFYFVV